MSTQKILAGQKILEHDKLGLELEDDIIEYRRQMEPDIANRLNATAASSAKQAGYAGKDFYVVMLVSVDRVLRQPRTVIFARKSCPTPVYKQSVWKYKTATGSLEFLWSIPDAILYYHILNNQTKYLQDKETSELAQFTILMESGELLEWVKKENGEKIDAMIHISNEENACLTN